MKQLMIAICILLSTVKATDVPIIGILSQESYSINKYFPGEKYDSFIAASYVKFLESAGARVIPVWIGQNKKYYEGIVARTNGLLLPGGATGLNQIGGYADAGQMLYNIALKKNKEGKHYPILGICLGMELLAQVAMQGEEIRARCSAYKLPLPLKFKGGYNASKTFSQAPKEITDILRRKSVTYNNHGYCLTEANFTRYGLDKKWRVLSTNKDIHGFEFISVYESKRYPFYGLQFHPEKNMFEFILNKNIPHSLDAIKIAQYFANLFVEETRKNNNSFPNWQAEQKKLIYNYNPVFIGIKNSSYEQVYVFKEDDYK